MVAHRVHRVERGRARRYSASSAVIACTVRQFRAVAVPATLWRISATASFDLPMPLGRCRYSARPTCATCSGANRAASNAASASFATLPGNTETWR